MDYDDFDRIKKLTVIAMFSDNDLFDKIVLKGGSAIDMFYPSAGRASLDLDFSIDGDFTENLDQCEDRFARALTKTLQQHQLVVFDVKLQEQPKEPSVELPFCGGYTLRFKVCSPEVYQEFKAFESKLRYRDIDVGPGKLKTMTVEFSKHEFCAHKEPHEIDHHTVYVYPPLMIACEKLRAICQQDAKYRERVKSRSPSQRARDFFDIHALSENYAINWTSDSTLGLIRSVFAAKDVDLGLLGHILDSFDLHRDGYPSLAATVRSDAPLKAFEFYFAYVLEIAKKLQPLWDE